MSLSCGLVGLPSCGKTVIFNAITAAGVSSYDGSEMNRAIVKLPDQRLEQLIKMYRPRKEVQANLEIVDIPGPEVGPQGNGRGSRLLGHIKDVEAPRGGSSAAPNSDTKEPNLAPKDPINDPM